MLQVKFKFRLKMLIFIFFLSPSPNSQIIRARGQRKLGIKLG